MGKDSKMILFTGILFLFFLIIVSSLFVGSIKQYNESNNLTYNDLLYMECTVESVRESGNQEDGYKYIFQLKKKKRMLELIVY